MTTTTPTTAARPAAVPRSDTPAPVLWRLAGGLAIAHVVLMLAGVLTMGTPTVHEGQEGIEHSYVEGSIERIFAGGYVETLAFVLLVPVLVFQGRAFGRRTEGGTWAAQSATAAGLCYVSVVVAGGFAAGAAAAWGASNGLDLETALTVNNIRNFAYFLGLALLGGHAVGLGVAALTDRRMTRWVGWGGVVTGVALLAAVPAASIGIQDFATLVWLVWWVGVAALMMRQPAGGR